MAEEELGLEELDEHSLFEMIASELAISIRSPAYEYMKCASFSAQGYLMSSFIASSQLQCKNVHVPDEHSSDKNVEFDVQSETLLNSDDGDFFEVFKLRKKTVQELIRILNPRLGMTRELGGKVSVHKMVLMSCWLLTTTEEFSAASVFFELSVNDVVKIFIDVCSELSKLVGQYVHWPIAEECTLIADSFETRFGFPGVVGVIGHSSFTVSASDKDSNTNCNTVPPDSFILQAVCDHNMCFRDVCAVCPNQKTPAEALTFSPLYFKLLSRTNPLIQPQMHILGGSDYPQLANLITPYSKRPLTEEEIKFNDLHGKTCSVIVECFQTLKSRFVRLNCIDIPLPSAANHVVIASCVIHNIALSQGDTYDQTSNVCL